MAIQRTCRCGKVFMAKEADVKRGWAKSCSKSCAAKKREIQNGHRYNKMIQYDHQHAMFEAGLDCMEEGWDGHKEATF